MRASWLMAVVVSAALVHAWPVHDEETYSGSKTLHAIKQFFSPFTSYFKSIPSKTPYDIAADVKEKVTDVHDWANENDSIQALRGALSPIKNWIKEKADTFKNQTFREMYDNVKSSVKDIDEKVGTWLQKKAAIKGSTPVLE